MDEPFDKAAFLEHIGGDEELMHRLFALFRETADEVFVTLYKSADDDTIWKKQLHLLRGSALNVGAEELCRHALAAEQDGHALSPAQKLARLELLRNAYVLVLNHMESIAITG